jgi:hypothetical protein
MKSIHMLSSAHIPRLGVRSVCNSPMQLPQVLLRLLRVGGVTLLAVCALNGVTVLRIAVAAGCGCISRRVCLIG